MGLLLGFLSPILGPVTLLASPLYMLEGLYEIILDWISFFA